MSARLALIACVVSACFACDTTSEVQAPSSSPQPSLSVVTWNLNWLHRDEAKGLTPRTPADYDALARYAEQLDADVVVLQEIDGEAAARRIFPSSRYAYHISSRDNVQRVGIVYKKHLKITRHADVVELARVHSERLRYGVDFSVFQGRRELRILGLHLKSGCFSSPLDGPYVRGERAEACQKLKAQVPVLTRWMSARVEAREAFAIMGDFNRRLGLHDEVWRQWQEDLPEAGLTSPTMPMRSKCWGGKYPELIDHIVMDQRAARMLRGQRAFQLIYDDEDASRHGYRLSDHCPVGVQ